MERDSGCYSAVRAASAVPPGGRTALLRRWPGVDQLRSQLANPRHRVVESLVFERPFVDQRVRRPPQFGVRVLQLAPDLGVVHGLASGAVASPAPVLTSSAPALSLSLHPIADPPSSGPCPRANNRRPPIRAPATAQTAPTGRHRLAHEIPATALPLARPRRRCSPARPRLHLSLLQPPAAESCFGRFS